MIFIFLNLNMNYNIYLLTHTHKNNTYLGITNNLHKRIRQHNGIIKGGAKYTSSLLSYGQWNIFLSIPNLTKSQALSFERKIKNLRHKAKGKTPLQKRLFLINLFFTQDQITLHQ